MNSQPAARAALQTSSYIRQVLPLRAKVAFILRSLSASRMRQKPTRIPYSCQDQFGTSGCSGLPIGGDSTARGMALVGSQTSTLTIFQTTTRAPPGSASGGRLTIDW